MIRAAALRWAQQIMASRLPDFIIEREHGKPYLLRWHIWRRPWCALYLHQFLLDDDDGALHDHPYENLSWVLSGGYIEHQPKALRWRDPGKLIFRLAGTAHRIELTRDLIGDGPHYDLVLRPALSLFLCGPRRREWGFHCPNGWVHWRDYVSQVQGGNTKGAGCL